VAVPDARLDDGHGGLGDDRLDQPGATARDDQVDQAACGQQRAHRVAAALEQRDGVGGKVLVLQGVPHHADQRPVGEVGGRATTQDDGVAGLQAEARGVDGDVGAGLVHHPHDAHRHPHLADLQPVGQGRAAHDLAHGVGQGGYVAQRLRHTGDPVRVQGQPVEQALRHTARAPPVEVLGVGVDDAVGGRDQRVGQREQRGVLVRPGQQRQAS
jgi:hypothetical protein